MRTLTNDTRGDGAASCPVRAGIPGLDAFAAMASEIHYIAAQLGQAPGQAWMTWSSL
jgi:hypothetical protein